MTASHAPPPAADDAPGDVRTLAITPAQHGERFDALITSLMPDLSRAMVQRLIEDGHVTVDGVVLAKSARRVKMSETVVLVVPVPEAIDAVPEDLPIVICFEDADLIVIDKAAGMVVHPAAGHPRGTLVNALLHHCTDLSGIGGALRPGIVHRLDKDTSGVMVVAKSERAHVALMAAFAAKSAGIHVPGKGVAREYLGIAAPPPRLAKGTLVTYHNRHPSDRRRFSSRVVSGKTAITHYQIVEPLGASAALVRFTLQTGRTHQIRVHATDHGWPLLGDQLYGKAPQELAPIAEALGRQALHAALLELDHPATGARLRFESPLPADLVAARAALLAGG